MASIDRAFIDQVLSSTDIVEIIKEKVTLQKNGTNYKGLCPFHNEKTPSFNVSSTKQFYHCFGCGASCQNDTRKLPCNSIEWLYLLIRLTVPH